MLALDALGNKGLSIGPPFTGTIDLFRSLSVSFGNIMMFLDLLENVIFSSVCCGTYLLEICPKGIHLFN